MELENQGILEPLNSNTNSTKASTTQSFNSFIPEFLETPKCYTCSLMITLIFNTTTILVCVLFFWLSPEYPVHTLSLAGFNLLFAFTILKCLAAVHRKSYKTQKTASGYLLGLFCIFVPLYTFLTLDFPLAWASECLGAGYFVGLLYFMWKGAKLEKEFERRDSISFHFEINTIL